MTDEQRAQCHKIIHPASAIAAAVGAGLAQVPVSDNCVIMPIQIGMILALAAVFGVSLEKTTAKSLLATKAATLVGRGLSQLVVGWIPILGNVVKAATAASVTETIGWAIAKDFATWHGGKRK